MEDENNLDENNIDRYLEKKDKKFLDWKQIHYNHISLLGHYRVNDMEKFRSEVTATDMSLEAHKDEEYYTQITILEHIRERIEYDKGLEAANIHCFDELNKILVKLIHRAHKPKADISQNIVNSKFVQMISKKLLEGIGQNILFTGKPGTGKSYSAITFGMEVSKTTGRPFDIKKNVCFTPKDFAKLYNSDDLLPGSVIILDEIGVSFGARDALTTANKLFSQLLQIIRTKAYLVIFTAPDLTFIDSNARKLLHYVLTAYKLIRNEGIAIFKPYRMKLDQLKGKVYTPHPMYEDGRRNSELRFTLLSKNYKDIYEVIANIYKDKVALRVELALPDLEDEASSKYMQYCRKKDKGELTKHIVKDMRITKTIAAKFEKMRNKRG